MSEKTAQDNGFDFRSFNGFDHPTTTPTPDLLFDQIMQDLNEGELKVLLYIVRRTLGFKKRTDNISLNQLVYGIKRKDGRVLDRGTGLSRSSVARALRSLKKKNLIDAAKNVDPKKGNLPTTYSLKVKLPPSATSGTRVVSAAGQALSHQRHPQQTVLQQTDVVVKKLKKRKIQEEKAQQLAARFSPDYIEQKIEFLEWKLDPETKSRGRRIEDEAGWLIRAIERDYKPPPAFKTKAERKKEVKELVREQAEREKRRQELRARREQEKAERLEEFKRKYGTTQRELDLWPQVLKDIEVRMTKATFQTWFSQTVLLSVKDGRALIGAPNELAKDWIENRLGKVIERTLADLGYEVKLEVEVI